MKCEFNPASCNTDCKKYLICSYLSLQKQFSEVQTQLNFIYSTVKNILENEETTEMKIALLESAVSKYVKDSKE